MRRNAPGSKLEHGCRSPAARPMIHEVSRVLRPGMKVWPGDPLVEMVPWTSIEQAGYRLHAVRFGEHTGTHLGAPSHYRPDGASLDQLDLAHFVGRCLVVDGGAGRDEAQLASSLAAVERTACTHLLFDFGDEPDRVEADGAGLVEGCLEVALEALPALRCVGTSRNNLDGGSGVEVGVRAATHGLSHLESLCRLGGVPRDRLLDIVVGCPLVTGATGMPCRVLIWE